MHTNTYAVILAGGKGERFWPMSTAQHPKQVLSLVGETPMIAQAVQRLEGLVPPERVFVITSADLVDAIRRATPALPAANVIGEPFGRDTAAAVALGATLVLDHDPNGVFCVLTADHVITPTEVFTRQLSEAFDYAGRHSVLITIGIPPRFPSTGFGYIEVADKIPDTPFIRARRFVEKPDLATAQKYVASGTFFWNSGMFVWSAACVYEGLRQHQPALSKMMDQLRGHTTGANFLPRVKTEYDKLTKISIDYALMEKADNVVMTRATFDWDDVGAWPALEGHLPKDAHHNAHKGATAILDAGGNVIVSDGRLVALIGVHDLVVVQSEGVVLVCPKDRAQDIKKMVEQLRAAHRTDVL